MTPETATFLLQILNACSISAGAEDFEQTATNVINAKRELAEVLAE